MLLANSTSMIVQQGAQSRLCWFMWSCTIKSNLHYGLESNDSFYYTHFFPISNRCHHSVLELLILFPSKMLLRRFHCSCCLNFQLSLVTLLNSCFLNFQLSLDVFLNDFKLRTYSPRHCHNELF